MTKVSGIELEVGVEIQWEVEGERCANGWEKVEVWDSGLRYD